MKHYILAMLLCCAGISAAGQGMFGAQTGIGYTTGYDSRITPAVEAYYLHKVMHHLYAGGSLFFQRDSFNTPLNTGSNINYGDVVSIGQKTSFVFLSPKVDYAIDYRSYFHVFATFGLGVRMGGAQWSYTHAPFWTPPGGTPYGADTIAVNTTYNLPNAITRFGFGLAERIPTRRYWNIMLSQEVGFMPGSLSKGATPLQTPYICFQVGLMHKYPQVFVEY
jgi:hypothetical protein